MIEILLLRKLGLVWFTQKKIIRNKIDREKKLNFNMNNFYLVGKKLKGIEDVKMVKIQNDP